ncbi:MAG: hypothetical protein HY698_20605 [Deltaproteobacteria bacterium]|nr:hypothetical protein [Deltaproteobacteria bacterium]
MRGIESRTLRARVVGALAVAVLVGGVPCLVDVALPAAADPLYQAPTVGKARWGGGDEDLALVGLLAEARLLAVPRASARASWPDRTLALEEESPTLVAGRIGVVVVGRSIPASLVLRADLAEGLREEETGSNAGWAATVDSYLDDAHLVATPWRPMQVVAGRSRVTWSKLRQFDEVDLPLGSVPFVIDRIAPDRRWGITVLGDLGALSYALGIHEDMDTLEPRFEGDPSRGGQLVVSGHVESTPRAPMMGSNPPGKIPGAVGPMPTPTADPWYDVARVSVGLGSMWRQREDATARLDVALSAHVKWRLLAMVAEVIGTSDGGEGEVGGYGELIVTPIDRVALTVRGEWDGGMGESGIWVGTGGITWLATTDRRNKVAVIGTLRRDQQDSMMVLFQASL